MIFLSVVIFVILIFIVAYKYYEKYYKIAKKETSSESDKYYYTYNINTGPKFSQKTMVTLIKPSKPEDLIEYSIPSSYSILEKNTLSICTNLKDLYLLENIYLIEDKSFLYCDNLVNINVHENNNNYSSKKGVLFTKDLKEIICYPSSKQSSTYLIPDKVEIINSFSFTNNQFLKYLILSNNVTTISENAVNSCKFLKQIVIPANVTNIHPMAFNMCPRISIRGYKNSVAEEYCNKYFIPFEYLNS